MAKPQKNKSLQKFRTAARGILIKLKLRKPKASNKNFIEEHKRDMHGTLGDSIIDLRTRSSSINTNPNLLNSDYQSEETYNIVSNYEGEYEYAYCKRRYDYETTYGEYEYELNFNTEKKRLPKAGSNFSKIPILSEIPKILNPAAWVSSKTQKDTKPIRN